MSIELTRAVWKHSRQKSGALLVLLALADYTNNNGIAWPAVSTLARKVRMSKRNVQRCVRALQQAGELEVRRNQGRNGSNVYRICVPTVEPDKRDANVTHDAGVAKALSPPSSTSHKWGVSGEKSSRLNLLYTEQSPFTVRTGVRIRIR
jgi:biotin operon repressor